MAKAGKTGVSAKTPKNILLGAGTIHKGLKYEGSSWNLEDTIIGSTSGGSKLTITPEITTIEADGALVRTKGLDIKTGEVATLEVNFLELSKEVIKQAIIGEDATSSDATYDLIESKANIEAGDYLENIAFVGMTPEGKNIIVILDNALCTSGFELEGKNKEAGVITLTFECSAAIDSELDKLPYHIYYPKATA